MVINYKETITKEIATLKREAIEKIGFDNFGEPFFEEPLAAWISDLKSGIFNDFGCHFLRRLTLKDLCRRLKVIAYLDDHPEILDVEIPPIIIIMAAPRTGTTLLHNLMATHPLTRTLLRWELLTPVPAPTLETYSTDSRIAKLQTSTEKMRGSLIEKMHWINADDPEENTWGFIDCTGVLGRSIEQIMPAWSQFLYNHDHRTTFRDFRKVIQLLLWKYPPPSGGNLLLKCVMTSDKIQMFAEEFPEAKFILVHRDPFRVLVSAATLTEGMYLPLIRKLPGPLHEDGLQDRIIINKLRRIVHSLVKFQKTAPEKITNIKYSDLMSDAVLASRLAYEKIEIEFPEDFEKRIIEFLEQQRSGKRAAPPKQYKNFGYDVDDVWSDPIVAQYCNVFDLEREHSRLIDTKTGT